MTATSPLTNLLISLAWLLPLLLVWLAGMGLAAARWRRHPAVSALLLSSLGMMLFVVVAHRLAFHWIIQSRSAGTSPETVGRYVSFLGLGILPFRVAAWIGIVAAVFGWRGQDGHAARPQFSIRSLLIVTMAAAILLGLGRYAVVAADVLPAFLFSLVDDVPIILIWLVGIWLAASRWRCHPRVSALTISGLGLMVVSFLGGQAIFLLGPLGPSDAGLRSLVSFVTSALAAVSYALLVSAALTAREPRSPQPGQVSDPELRERQLG